MQILVFSDSHGNTARMKEIAARSRAEVILFLGDGLRDFETLADAVPQGTMLLAVRGNCDGISDGVPAERILTLEGIRILMLHGHTRSVKHGTEALVSYARAQEIDLVLYGHTHTPDDRRLFCDEGGKPLYILNPGSIGGGYFGSATFGTVEIRHGQMLTNIASCKEINL